MDILEVIRFTGLFLAIIGSVGLFLICYRRQVSRLSEMLLGMFMFGTLGGSTLFVALSISFPESISDTCKELLDSSFTVEILQDYLAECN